jgi:predicted AAA+ superfamily ATPase
MSMGYVKRAIEPLALSASETFPVLLITGPRQAGKTTLLQKLGNGERAYVTLDDPEARMQAKSDPALFLQRYQPPLTIDEIQYAPELLPYIKMNVDRSRRCGDYWLTGSQMFHAMRDVSESLAGRVGIMNLLGLSNAEINNVPNEPFTTGMPRLIERMKTAKPMSLTEIFGRIYRGGLPALHARPNTDLDTFYSSYAATYLQRDIRDLSQVGDETAFYNFMVCAAARTAKPVIYEELARECGISAPTAKKWLSVLVTSHIVALVQPYYNNAIKRAAKTPLMHFLDTGLCAHLLKWGSAETLERGAMSGAFFESWVFSEIYKSYANAAKTPPMYYYRDKDKREIDIVMNYDGALFPVEVKKSASPGKDAIKHFHALEQSGLPVGNGAVVCMYGDVLPIDRQNCYVPAWLI